MPKREFIGYYSVTGEKVYKVDLGLTVQYQTEAGKFVSNTDIIKKKIPK